ncbi:hypothetical protein [Nocardioides sp. GY 10127]|uniref:hypothetical protein n=1 Tax=Nocardioides sp. GY 10127 TaxID=2569762 RepID=UPI0010A7AE60|nr:hypothetical protein [Nocardioides sp. GY 10127]TIC82849.1 hypothetical protein E8D37_09285 [Nocardioides sp. GY 10127]
MTTFLVLGVAGLALLLLSLVLGDVLDGFLDGLDGLGDGLGGDVFSTAVIGSAVAAFGFSAGIVEALDAPFVVSLLAGVAGGTGFGALAVWLTRLLRHDEAEPPSTGTAVGHEALVLTAVPADGYGTVRVLVGGRELRLNARLDADHPLPLEAGERVHVTGSLSPTAVTVAPLWRELG